MQMHEHNQSPIEIKMPSFGIEDVDNRGDSFVTPLTIGLAKLQLQSGSAVKSSVNKRVSNITDSGSSNQSMDSSEENDKVAMMDDQSAFRQLDYLWLFDTELKFSER